MRALTLVALLALAALCLAGQAEAKPSGAESGRGSAFVSKREGSEVVKRARRQLTDGPGAPAPYPDPLEPKREVCELNPDCDELADQVGLQEAYQRFYGPV
ncbi:osteocalcin [Lepus europaeus]|uniref:osteocalcin n=1 Tax=Lepus europaeus TaxID=9983 RepID=UPI002B45A20B|nr:osteocalcin [Lepus europaeus]